MARASSAPGVPPFQLLELSVISGQSLENVTRRMKTYAVVWIHPERKLCTRIDSTGGNNPTWNDKFVFRVDNNFLQNDLSAINIEIYSTHWWRDILVGSIRVLVGNLISKSETVVQETGSDILGMDFAALQVRRPSSRIQGILNVGLTLLDSSMRSMPLYSQTAASAVGYKDLMGKDLPISNHHDVIQNFHQSQPISEKEFRRTASDTSSMVASMKGSSLVHDSMNLVGGSVASGVTQERKGNSDIAKEDPRKEKPQLKGRTITKFDASDANVPCITNSELGPSPSEVAAMIERWNAKPTNSTEISSATGWSLDTEGLYSKLARWRADLPPVGGQSDFSSLQSRATTISSSTGGRKLGKHRRRRAEEDEMISCFGSFCGVGVSIACRKPKKNTKKKEKIK